MITTLTTRTERNFTTEPQLTPWEWAAANINYGRVPNYDTPFSGPFDPELLPFWKEPLEASTSLDIREVVVVKPSRAGGSENFLLTRMRHAIAVDPQPTFYVTSDIESAETFMEDRIKRGCGLCPITAKALRESRATEHSIRFPAMDLRVSWARSKRTYKQDGYSLICCDEVSTWPSFAADQIRKRGDMYLYHHILFVSSPDPTRRGNPDNDPILVLYHDTDQRLWFMPDPGKKGKRFTYEFGGPDESHGVKWPKSAKHGDEWDLDEVREKARYVTRAGTEITNDQREDLMRAGEWRATAESKRADVVGFKPVAAMIPTKSGDYGELAARFLAAKYHLKPDGTKAEMAQNPIRVYFAEYWAEAHREDRLMVHDDTLEDRWKDYGEQNVYVPKGYDHGLILTLDVQKFGLWYVARTWSFMRKTKKTESALAQYGKLAALVDVDDLAATLTPDFIGFDLGGFSNNVSGIADYCAQYTDQRHPEKTRVFGLRGSDSLKAPVSIKPQDAHLGRANKHGQALFMEVMWNTDIFRSWLIDMMEGRDLPWWVMEGIADSAQGRAYLEQVSSTKRGDRGWEKPGHGRDHYWDCECMQLVLARMDGVISGG